MKYFGTDGFRGAVNEKLTVDHAIKIGKFLGYYFGKDKKGAVSCCIGKDTRRSGYMFEYALVAGLTSTGAEVALLHVTTTPSVSFITKTEDFDFGIMITASHNPYSDNGIKIIDSNGYKMAEEVLVECERFIDDEFDIPLSCNDMIGRAYDYIQGRNKYIGHLSSVPMNSFRGYRVGLDCSNGASFTIARTVFEMLGAKITVIGDNPDGFNINRDCGSTHIEKLQALVRENQLDIGFAFDGDADRCIAVDENGNVVDGDMIIYICGSYLMEKGALNKNTVVTTIMSNIGLTKALNDKGITNIQTQVGDKYVSAKMEEGGYSIGGEQSGHVIFNKYATTGDGILTAILLMDVVVNKKTTPSALYSDVTLYPQTLINVRVKDMDEALNNNALKALLYDIEKELGDSGRIVLRKSGTEPLIRIMVEAATEEASRVNAEKIKDVIVNC